MADAPRAVIEELARLHRERRRITRNAWLVLVAIVAGNVAYAIRRALGVDEAARGRLLGPWLAIVVLSGIGLALQYGMFRRARQIATRISALRVGLFGPIAR